METLADAAATRGEAEQIGWASFTTVVRSPGEATLIRCVELRCLPGAFRAGCASRAANQHETGVLASLGETTCWATLDRR